MSTPYIVAISLSNHQSSDQSPEVQSFDQQDHRLQHTGSPQVRSHECKGTAMQRVPNFQKSNTPKHADHEISTSFFFACPFCHCCIVKVHMRILSSFTFACQSLAFAFSSPAFQVKETTFAETFVAFKSCNVHRCWTLRRRGGTVSMCLE